MQALLSLPPKRQLQVPCELTAFQRQQYDLLIAAFQKDKQTSGEGKRPPPNPSEAASNDLRDCVVVRLWRLVL